MKDLDIVILQLRDGRAKTRATAARTLSEHPSPLARKDLLRCLNDSDDEVRYWATVALSGLDDEKLTGRIAAQLDDPATQVRMVAAKVLATRPYRGAVQNLLRSLGDPDENVAYWAGQALGALGEYALPQLVAALGDDAWKRRAGAARVIERAGVPVVPYLVRALARDDDNVRYWTLRLLGQLRAFDALPELTRFLQAKERDLVIAAATALGELGDRRAIPELIRLLAHSDELVRRAVIDALARLPDSSVHELTQMLGANQRLMRLSSSLALAAAGDSSLKPLLDQLAAESSETRYWVVRALERMRQPAVVPVLEELVDDDDVEVQRAAASALASFVLPAEVASRLVERLDTEDWRLRQGLADALAAQGHLPASLFERALAHGSEHQRYWLARVLGHHPSPDVVPLLIERFEDESWPIRKNAAASIARIGPAASRYLIEVLARPELDADQRYWVSRAMIGLADPALLPTLIGMLADPDRSVRANAATAVEQLGDRAVPQLLEALRVSTSRMVREAIAGAVVRTGGRHVEQITRMFQFRDPEVNYWAGQILARIGAASIPALTRLANEEDQRIRYHALSAIGQMNTDEAVAASLEALTDNSLSIRRLAVENLGRCRALGASARLIDLLGSSPSDLVPEVIRALGQIGDTGAIAAIEPFIRHDRWDIRRAALEALGRIGGDQAGALLTAALGEEQAPDILPFLIRAVGHAGASEAVPGLLAKLDAGGEVGLAALSALGELKAGQAADRIVEKLDDDSWEMRRAALRALGQIGASFPLDRLKPVLAGEDMLLRHEAREALRAALGTTRWQEYMALTVRRSLREPADELYAEALRRAEAHQSEEAERLLRKALRMSKRPEYYALLGSIQLERRNLAAAVRSLKRAAQSVRDPVLDCKLAVAYFLNRDWKRAQAQFTRVLEHPDCPSPVRELAQKSIAKIQSAGR